MAALEEAPAKTIPESSSAEKEKSEPKSNHPLVYLLAYLVYIYSFCVHEIFDNCFVDVAYKR